MQTEPPIDLSSLTRWRTRLGKAGLEVLLSATIAAGQRSGALRKASLKNVIVETTVMPKAVAHPTDSRLLERSREHLDKAAGECGVKLRQNYNREAPRLAPQVGRYAHARQFKCMNKSLCTLRGRAAGGRLARHRSAKGWRARVKLDEMLALTKRILDQNTKDKGKLYALHAPEVECISKVQSAHALRIRCEGLNQDHIKRRPSAGRALRARQSVRWTHLPRSAGTGRYPG